MSSNNKNLLSAPSTSDISETENKKYSKSNQSMLGYLTNSIYSLFSSGNTFEKNVKKNRPRKTSVSSYNSSIHTTTQNVLNDNDEDDYSSYSSEEYTAPSRISSSTTTATSGALIFGLSTSFFMQLLLLIILLAVLGINIFHYLGYGLDTTGDVVNQTLDTTGKAVVATGDKVKEIGTVGTTQALPVSGQTVKNTAIVTGEGTKGLVDVTVGAVDKSVNLVTGETGTDLNNVSTSSKSKYVNDTIDLALEKQPKTSKKKEDNNDEDESKEELGWCYIGREGGARSCALLGEGMECVSGEIFGSREVCINPNLRE